MDRLLQRAVIEWWTERRPAGWTMQQHLAHPTVNCTGSEIKLARAVARMIRPKRQTLKMELRRYGITHDQVAAAAKRPVARTTVVHVLAGRVTSRNVLEAAERLIRDAKQRRLLTR